MKLDGFSLWWLFVCSFLQKLGENNTVNLRIRVLRLSLARTSTTPETTEYSIHFSWPWEKGKVSLTYCTLIKEKLRVSILVQCSHWKRPFITITLHAWWVRHSRFVWAFPEFYKRTTLAHWSRRGCVTPVCFRLFFGKFFRSWLGVSPSSHTYTRI